VVPNTPYLDDAEWDDSISDSRHMFILQTMGQEHTNTKVASNER